MSEIYQIDKDGIARAETLADCEGYYDLDDPGTEFDFLAYWYESGSYDGNGFAIFRKETKGGPRWFGMGLSHCSCYSPFDDAARLLAGAGEEHVPDAGAGGYLDDDNKRGKALAEFVASVAKERGWKT